MNRPIILTLTSLFVACLPAAAWCAIPDEAALADQLWRRTPVLLEGRRAVADAQSFSSRSHLLPNPSLTATWATIPIGERPDHVGFSQVPSYSMGIGQLIELGKRGPRQEAAAAALDSTRFQLAVAFQDAFATLLGTFGEQAEALARTSALRRLAADNAEILRLQRARADRGDVAALEVDRLEVEHLRLTSSVRQAESQINRAAIACAALLAAPCPRFGTEAEALTFLGKSALLASSVDSAQIETRPEVAALGADSRRLSAELRLARRASVPDPSVFLSYTHDQFVHAGNQANSLTLAVSVPLPVFDRAQPERIRAQRLLDEVKAARETLPISAARSVDEGRQRLGILLARADLLDHQVLPRAQDVATRVETAARRGGAALPEVLLARRTLEELQLERVDLAGELFQTVLTLRRTLGSLPRPPRG